MTPDRHGLDVYLRSVNEEVQTMKMSSELWHRSPPRHEIHENDRFVRSLVGEGLGWAASVPPPQVEPAEPESAEPDPDLERRAYWEAAEQGRDVAVHFGAAGHPDPGAYFMVDTSRSGEEALARARNRVVAFSPADYLLRCVDRLSAATGASPAQSCRRMMGMLARDWPVLIRACRARSASALRASDLFREFYRSFEARTVRQRGPEDTSPGPRADDPPVLLRTAEASELATLYMLGRFCFTAEECRMAESLVAMPRLRSALLAVHLQLTAGSLEPLGRLVTDFGTPRVLLPFTEAFVNRHGYGPSPRLALSPNPKLLTVLCNNVVPAVAGELLRRGARAGDLDSDSIRAGVVAARRRHVYQVMIALLGRVDGPHPDALALSGFSLRVCPAAAPFSAFLEEWLPYHFDRFSPSGEPAGPRSA
jgi:hypothetical protein